jgi:aryl-alcohol dehydrogenase-like predicted oxidoreductase
MHTPAEAVLCYAFGMKRRDFLKFSLLAGTPVWGAPARQASDVVYLGPDKIRLTRLAMGTGTLGGRQGRILGIQGLADLLHFGYDNGLIFWDAADSYGSHPHLKEALKRVPREKVAIMTKSFSRTADGMRKDMDRFRRETGTDYFDIVLVHAVTKPDWPDECKGAMEALSELREKGIVRTHGVSCHSLEALKVAAKTPWVKVDLARINPAGAKMDADPQTVLGVLREMKAAGQGVIGMKILGEGALRDRVDQALAFALAQSVIDCFTIGAENRGELADLIKRIPQAAQAASKMPQAA